MKTLVKLVGIIIIVMLCPVVVQAQQRDVRIPTDHHEGSSYKDYASFERGFFCAVETGASYLIDRGRKPLIGELDAVGGYRFNDYLRVGLGIGVRYFDNSDHARFAPSRFGMPLYLDVRGNFIPSDDRDVVPYYSLDLGTSFPDGFMFRPTIGFRIGQQRSAFLVGLSYLGQNIRTIDVDNDGQIEVKRKFMSGISLRVGYEF